MPQIEIAEDRHVEVTHLKAECGVRYWEDAKVDGVEDTDGDLIPCRARDVWAPLINLSNGKIENWDYGKVATIHYKVCDAGRYALLDASGSEVVVIDGYVPSIMSPGGSGYGDYVIMTVDHSGQIENWQLDLQRFQEE